MTPSSSLGAPATPPHVTPAHAIPVPVAVRTAAVCTTALITAALFTAVGVTGAEDLVLGMPLVPWWVPAVAGPVLACLVLLGAQRPAPGWRIGVVVASLAMLAASVLALPHTILFAVIWAVSRVTGAPGPFQLEPHWLTASAHLSTAVTAGSVVGWLVVDRRARSGRCARCGLAGRPPRPLLGRTAMRAAALVAGGAALPYGLLKLAWGLGWRGGVVGPEFEQVRLDSPGFGDTVVLAGISVAVTVVMAVPVRHRLVRLISVVVGATGTVMLVPAGLVGTVMLVGAALGRVPVDERTLASWVFVLVYGCFLAWGLALGVLTVAYWSATRRPCSSHAVTAAVKTAGRTPSRTP